MQLAEKLKRFIPPVLKDLFKPAPQIRWTGPYASWTEVAKSTGGYDAADILDNVASAIMKVKRGEAVYERDGALFDQVQYNWPFLSALGYALLNRPADKVNLLDFGGSLGSSYFQHKWFFKEKINKWIIVEQPGFVARGNQSFADGCLSFYYDLNEVVTSQPNINILLFSSVLQYLPDPFSILDQYVNTLKPQYLIVDRTPIVATESFIARQDVKESIVTSSYPLHFFGYDAFIEFFNKKGYHATLEFQSFCDPRSYSINNTSADWKGFLFVKQ